MKRYGMTIRIKAGCERAYRKHHNAVWPEVVEMIRACNIADYSIFLRFKAVSARSEHGSASTVKPFTEHAQRIARQPGTHCIAQARHAATGRDSP
jgi:L-rhamnose mutarotase